MKDYSFLFKVLYWKMMHAFTLWLNTWHQENELSVVLQSVVCVAAVVTQFLLITFIGSSTVTTHLKKGPHLSWKLNTGGYLLSLSLSGTSHRKQPPCLHTTIPSQVWSTMTSTSLLPTILLVFLSRSITAQDCPVQGKHCMMSPPPSPSRVLVWNLWITTFSLFPVL